MKSGSLNGRFLTLIFLLVLFGSCGQKLQGQVIWKKATGIDSLCTNSFLHDGLFCYAATADSGVYKSTDGGLSWLQANTGVTDSFQLRSANCFSLSGDNLYVAFGHALGGHIYYSPDRAANWFTTGFPTGATDLVAIDSVVCASTGSGFFLYARSTDWGGTWQIQQYPFQQYYYRYQKHGDSLFCLSNSLGLRLSTDRGISWNTIGFQGVFNNDYFINAGLIGIANSGGIYVSADVGLNWKKSPMAGLKADSCRIRCFSTAGGFLFASSDTAIYSAKITKGNLITWSAIPDNNLPMLDPLHYISALDAGAGILKIGTCDATQAGASSAAKGMGIWYTTDVMLSDAEEVDNVCYLNVMPNPARSEINIETAMHEFSITLTDGPGRLYILERNKTHLDISHLPAGLYMLRLTDSSGHFASEKIIKY